MATSEPAVEMLDEVGRYHSPGYSQSHFISVKSIRRKRGDILIPVAFINREMGEEGYSGALIMAPCPFPCLIAIQEEFKTTQNEIEASMIKIVSAPEPFPLPGRPVRRLVASLLKALYTRGETKSLYDTIQAFLKLLAETKPPAKESSRMYVCPPRYIYVRLMLG